MNTLQVRVDDERSVVVMDALEMERMVGACRLAKMTGWILVDEYENWSGIHHTSHRRSDLIIWSSSARRTKWHCSSRAKGLEMS